MRKLVSLLLALTMVLGLGAFAVAEDYELALVTDVGTIDDKAFNQGAWEGLVQYAEENGVTYKYYQPVEVAIDAYLDGIELAVEGGAKVIVTPGYLFEVPIFMAQDMYPDVNFVLVDGYPNDDNWDSGPEYRTEDNVIGIKYADEQSGFLAGYAVVKEGYTKLGFMGGMAVPAVIRFGHGFVQGANYAAEEMGLEEVTVNYHYTGAFAATPEAQTTAATWYNDGVEVIFACGGALGNSVMVAAEANEGDKWVVGVDVDQSVESEKVITSATKGLAASVYQAIDAYYKGEFPGGESWILGADRDGVSLPMENSHFSVFTQADYDAILAKLAAGEIELVKDETNGERVYARDLATDITKVTEID